MSSYSLTFSETFTITHAKHMAAKVAADLKRMQRFYGQPCDEHISVYEAEVVELLRQGYLGEVIYGFEKNGSWIEPTLKYTAKDLANGTQDDDPGRLRPGANITGASFYSYLTYSANWDSLTSTQQTVIKEKLPLKRGSAPEPQVYGGGYFSDDKVYSAGGRSLGRAIVRSY